MGYVTGPGFKGMRKYLRRKSSHGWIINLTPEGKQPPATNAVFNIETPVGIAIFARTSDVDESVPADIKYLELNGTRGEKFADLQTLTFSDSRWRPARTDWEAPFTPAARTNWDSFPPVADLMPWRSTGVTPNRNWVRSPDKETLHVRLRALLSESDPAEKIAMFKVTRDRDLNKTTNPLPGFDVELGTDKSLTNTPIVAEPKTVQITFRAFDRQWLLADNRVLDMARPPLWEARVPGQVYVVEQHSVALKDGPGLLFTGHMPDINAFNNRGGRTLPRLHPDGSLNVAEGLEAAMKLTTGETTHAVDLVYYIAAVTGHRGFVEQFEDELTTPGIRVPFTAETHVWESAVKLGRHVVWLQTFGLSGSHPLGHTSVLAPEPGLAYPSYAVSVGPGMPTDFTYDPATETLHIGAGRWTGVSEAAYTFSVGGVRVVESWVKYRLARPTGRISSPLDRYRAQTWPAEWSVELTELLAVLTQLNALEAEQAQLLSDVLAGKLVTADALARAGVRWPVTTADRSPKRQNKAGLFE